MPSTSPPPRRDAPPRWDAGFNEPVSTNPSSRRNGTPEGPIVEYELSAVEPVEPIRVAYVEPERFAAAPAAPMPAPRFPAAAVAAAGILGLALFMYCLRRDFLLGRVAAVVVTPLVIHGLWRGAFHKLVMLPVSIGLLYGVVFHSDAVAPITGLFAETPSTLANVVVTTIGAVILLLIVRSTVRRVRRERIDPVPAIRRLDTALGAIVGLIEGGVAVMTICWMAVLARPYVDRVADPQRGMDPIRRTGVPGGLIQVADEIERSPLAEWSGPDNPLSEVRAIRDMLDRLSANGALDAGTDEVPDVEAVFRQLLDGMNR